MEDINQTLVAFEAVREKLENGTYAKYAAERTVDVTDER
jgi:glycine C-acetyltransferase